MLRTFAPTVRELRGPDAADALLTRVRPELRDGLRLGAISASTWYPVEWLAELQRAACEVTGEDESLAHEIGRATTRKDFSGAYRFFTIVMSPEGILTRVSRIFGMFWDTGSVHASVARHGYATLQFSGCVGFDRRLWAGLSGASEMIAELGGARDLVPARLSGGGDGDEAMVLEFKWR